MNIQDGCYSLKLECALRSLGFVEIGWEVIAHAGLFFVSPVSYTSHFQPEDDLLGFLLRNDTYNHIVPSAKRALDLASELTLQG